MKIRPLTPFGAELLDFRIDQATKDDWSQFLAGFRQYSLLVLHDDTLTPEGQLKLLGHIGQTVTEMFGGSNVNYVAHDPAIPGPPVGRGELQFHFDMVWADDWPFHAVSLYAEEVPSKGGETRFVHGGLTYRSLPESLRAALVGRRAVHIFDPYLPPDASKLTEEMMSTYAERAVHDIVKTHPYQDEDVVSLAYINTDRIVGLGKAESRALLDRLYGCMYDPSNIYEHRWKIGDLVMWDNRVVQHARGDFDPAERRRLRRVSVGDQTSIQRRTRRYSEQVAPDAGIAQEALLNSIPDLGKNAAAAE